MSGGWGRENAMNIPHHCNARKQIGIFTAILGVSFSSLLLQIESKQLQKYLHALAAHWAETAYVVYWNF